jgi:hypothetical protein
MKEKDLIELGFQRSEDQTPEMTGFYRTYYYYTLYLGNDTFDRFCLISNASYEAEENNWNVIIFDYETFVFKDRYQLEKLINVLRHNEDKK